MLEPASHSTPPPPREDARPMSFFIGFMWIAGAHMLFLYLVFALISLRESASQDLVSQLLCQVLAYGLIMFAMLRVHGPDSSIRAFIGWRRPRAIQMLLAAMLGLATAPPATWLFGWLDTHFPSSEPATQFAQLFHQAGTVERLGIAAGVILIGPLAEEVIFRGALFGPLLRYRPAPRTQLPASVVGQSHALNVVFFTSLLFAAVHHDWRRMVPILAVGVLLGLCRLLTRSVLVGFMMHACFNSIPVVALMLSKPTPEALANPERINGWLAIGGLLVSAACIAALLKTSKRDSAAA